MPAKKPLQVVLMWHMHQPDYRNLLTGAYCLPWTYLHAMKDYSDMAAHLEANPQARAVVNFSPVLLEQLADYSIQLTRFLQAGEPLRDPWLHCLAEPRLPENADERKSLIEKFLYAHEHNMVGRFEAYALLVKAFEFFASDERALVYLNQQYLRDLVVWFHLAWAGEQVRRTDLRIKRLTEKARQFSSEDCHTLLEVIAELVSGIIPKYRAMAQSGQIELAMNPYAHPIIPLMLDFGSAREAMPDVALPRAANYPGGVERARWQLQKGLQVFEQHFGCKPSGCWPAEGGVSEDTLALLDEFDFVWAASGENVLKNSLHSQAEQSAQHHEGGCHQAYRLASSRTAMFFRDDGLSDLIGFTYSGWHADDAINNLVNHLEVIAEQADEGAIVAIVLDGENAWEHYAFNGYYFLDGLYKRLSSHAQLKLTTFTDSIARQDANVKPLGQLVAGSWVYGTFSTWIGMRDKNRAWDMLVEAKICFDQEVAAGRILNDRLEQATRQLAVCESSDWFWWFGDYNASASVQSFDKLYRENLANLYHLLGVKAPTYLATPFTYGSEAAHAGGSMRPGSEG